MAYDDLRQFLFMQIMKHRVEKDRIKQDPDQFLAGDEFDVRVEVANDGINDKRQQRPTHGRPKQAVLWIDPEPAEPNNHDRQNQPFDHHEVLGPHRPRGQWREQENGQHQSENDAFAPGVELFAIHWRFSRGGWAGV